MLKGGTTSYVLCVYEIMLFKKGVGPKSVASDWQIIDFNKSKYHALSPTAISLDVAKKLVKYLFLVFLPKILSKNLQ